MRLSGIQDISFSIAHCRGMLDHELDVIIVTVDHVRLPWSSRHRPNRSEPEWLRAFRYDRWHFGTTMPPAAHRNTDLYYRDAVGMAHSHLWNACATRVHNN